MVQGTNFDAGFWWPGHLKPVVLADIFAAAALAGPRLTALIKAVVGGR